MLDPSARVEEVLLHEMTDLLVYRGPDEEGHYINGRIGLGHRRLSIVDLAGGRQPISNEDNTLWIIFNGEIYNHLEIRSDLERRGHRYKTRCDTETILHAYEEYGTDCVTRLRGMFAFAIWDEKNQTLFAARDRFGIKPFYYWLGPDSFSFASEMKALLLDPDLEVTLNAEAIYDYFTFKFIPGPNTPWREIKRLQPAHWLLIRDGKVRIERYWQPQFNGLSSLSEEEHIDQLETLLKASIKDHMMSEVPQGVFLSGGIDSSLIVTLMNEITTEPIRTFSITFEGKPGYDEGHYSRGVAEACHTRHFCYDCSPDAIATLPDILWHIEEPLADPAMIPLYELCRQASREVTVVHCGDGGDEAFGGYPRFYWDQYAEKVARIPEGIRKNILAPLFRLGWRLPEPLKDICRRGDKFCTFAGLPAPERYMNWFAIIPDATKHQILHPDLLAQVNGHRSTEVFGGIFADAAQLGLSPLSARQYCELRSFIPDDLMLKSDKVAMSAGLEGRFPFLDERLVEFGLALPPHQKISRLELKKPLRKILARHKMGHLVNQRKHGFEVPVGDWLKGRLERTLRETVNRSEMTKEHILNVPFVEGMLANLHSNNPILARQLFKVFVLLRWYNLFAHPKQLSRDRLKATRPPELQGK